MYMSSVVKAFPGQLGVAGQLHVLHYTDEAVEQLFVVAVASSLHVYAEGLLSD